MVCERPSDRRLRPDRDDELRRGLHPGRLPTARRRRNRNHQRTGPAEPVDYIRKELAGPDVAPLQEFAQGANSGIQATYTESLNPDTSLKTVVDYIPHGATLYKFYLTHWTGDRNEPALDATLANLVREAQLR